MIYNAWYIVRWFCLVNINNAALSSLSTRDCFHGLNPWARDLLIKHLGTWLQPNSCPSLQFLFPKMATQPVAPNHKIFIQAFEQITTCIQNPPKEKNMKKQGETETYKSNIQNLIQWTKKKSKAQLQKEFHRQTTNEDYESIVYRKNKIKCLHSPRKNKAKLRRLENNLFLHF